MGINDRDYAGPGSRGRFAGGPFSFLGRVLGQGTNPLSAGFRLYRAWGITVRVSFLFVLVTIFEILGSIPRGGLGIGFSLIAFACLYLLVLLHEYGHCLACRLVKGEADEILLWPLGGLAACRPPHAWRASLITTLGGPAVNVAILPLTYAALAALTQGWTNTPGATWLSPLNPFSSSWIWAMPFSWLGIVLAWLHYTNLVLLAFNMLVPMYPMDAGRVVFALLWPRVGHDRALMITANLGLIVALVLAALAFGMLTGGAGASMLAVALFGGVTCWMERERLRLAGPDWSSGLDDATNRKAERLARQQAEQRRLQAEQRQQQARVDQAEVDRILDKIHAKGLHSLTNAERKTLERASKQGSGAA